MKEKLVNIVYYFVDLLPPLVQHKIKIILNVLFHDWRISSMVMPGFDYYKALYGLSDEEIERRCAGLDQKSLAVMKRFIRVQTRYYITDPANCFYSRKGIYTQAELRESRKWYRESERMRRKYKLRKFVDYASSLVLHHGLRELDDKQKEYLQGSVFVDAGAFIGDSTLVMLQYNPEKIYAFEPSRINGAAYCETMKKNHIPSNRFELVYAGLGKDNTTIESFDDTGFEGTNITERTGNDQIHIVTLDSFMKDRAGRVGFIKTDVEGAGVDLIRGAEQTIRRDLPVLSLAIYHNEDELFGTYQLLKSWELPYRYELKKMSYCWENAEIILMAYPEINHGAK